jgi:hypothetical protein
MLHHHKIGVLYNHHTSFNPLFNALDKRGIEYDVINPSQLNIDTTAESPEYALIVNDLSTPPYVNPSYGITADYLEVVSAQYGSHHIVNGSTFTNTVNSRTKQIQAFAKAGVAHPKSIIASNVEQFLKATHNITFPILVGGVSGQTAMYRFDSEEELIEEIIQDRINFSKGPILIQAFTPAKQNAIIRAEILNGRFVYAVKISSAGESSSLWPIQTQYELYIPPVQTITAIEKIARNTLIDIGTITYVTDRRTNEAVFYGIEPHTSSYSQSVEGIALSYQNLIVDYIEDRLRKVKEIALAI